MDKRILNRITVINNSFQKKENKEEIREQLKLRNPKDVYKLIYNYTKIDPTKRNFDLTLVWQEYLVRTFLDNINLDDIVPSERGTNGRDLFLKKRIGVEDVKIPEKLQCRELISVETCLGKLKDFQVPLNADDNDNGAGELDIVAQNDREMTIIEYKTPISDEPLLRAVLEIITYFHQINGRHPENSGYLKSFNDIFDLDCNSIGTAIVLPLAAYRIGHKKAFELINEYHIKCYCFESDTDYTKIRAIPDTELKDLKEEALKNGAEYYKCSDEIVKAINILG